MALDDALAEEFRGILTSMRRAAAALREADVPFALGGSMASWARGGPETCNDVDLLVGAQDAERALEALEAAGMRRDDAPEHWLVKVRDGDVLVDLIFELTGVGGAERVIQRAETMRVAALEVPVACMDDVLTAKLLALDEHNLDLSGPLRIARATREQIDWPELRSRTAGSPYAAAFFTLCDELGVTPDAAGRRPPQSREGAVRVVPVAPPG